MAVTLQTGDHEVRKRAYDATVKGFATQMYKFKQAVSIVTTSAWTNFFYREDPTALSGPSGNAILAIPRGAQFPKGHPKWQLIKSTIQKYGLEKDIPWEDIRTNDIDVVSRTLFRIAEGVTKAVDDEIYTVLSTDSLIHSFSAANSWEDSGAKIVNDLTKAVRLFAENNYPIQNVMAFVTPRGHAAIVNYLADKGAQWQSIGTDMATNGKTGRVAGVTIVQSNSVAASHALVVVPKICGNWKAVSPLSTVTIDDPGIALTIRSFEAGVTQLTDPKCVALISSAA